MRAPIATSNMVVSTERAADPTNGKQAKSRMSEEATKGAQRQRESCNAADDNRNYVQPAEPPMDLKRASPESGVDLKSTDCQGNRSTGEVHKCSDRPLKRTREKDGLNSGANSMTLA
jgi:hypothetical protein